MHPTKFLLRDGTGSRRREPRGIGTGADALQGLDTEAKGGSLPKGNQCVLQRSCIATATGDNGRGYIEKVFAN